MKDFKINFPGKNKIYALTNGALTSVNKKKYIIDTETGELTIVCSLPDGKEMEFCQDKLFESIRDYKEGKNASFSSVCMKLSGIIPGETETNSDEDLFKYVWVIKDGAPEKKYLLVHRKITLDTSYHIESGVDIPDEWYSSRSDCIKWNDLKIIDGDGNEIEEKSIHKSLILTKEQQSIIGEIRDVFNKAKDAGIVLGYDHTDARWYALNKTETEARFAWDDDILSDEEELNYYDWLTKRRYTVDIPIPHYLTDCDCTIAVKKNLTEE